MYRCFGLPLASFVQRQQNILRRQRGYHDEKLVRTVVLELASHSVNAAEV
jgi:hypothetical protein